MISICAISERVRKYPASESPANHWGGGAPKFFLNWLTFARVPYDADQI